MELTAARRHWKKESLREASWALPYSLSSSVTVGDMPRKVQGAIYADDLVLWCSEEHLSTANYRMQQVQRLRRLDKPVACKNQFQEDHLYHLQPFNKGTEGHPAYQRPDSACWGQPHLPGGDFRQAADLETTDWKGWSQSQGATCPHEEVGRHDMGSRYCDSKQLYTGRVRPVLEYGMTAWGTTAKSNFDRVSKVQNQATRIITGAMKSTPIMELETITGLQSLDDRRDLKLLSQAAKFKRLQGHPMRQRLSQPTKGRLKRESFIHQSRMLERRQKDILDHDPKRSPHILRFLPGVGELLLSFGVPSQVLVRKTPKAALRESPSLRNTLKLTTQKGPGPSGTLMALLRMQFGMEGQESTSRTQEAKKTKLADRPILHKLQRWSRSPENSSSSYWSQHSCFPQRCPLQSNRDTELNDLSAALASLCRRHAVTLQWIPSHCNLPGNEAADSGKGGHNKRASG